MGFEKIFKYFIVFMVINASIMIGAQAQETSIPEMEKIKKITGPVEAVVILDDSRGMSDSEFEKMLELVRRLPDACKIGEKDVRMAIITFHASATVELPLTSNETEIRFFNITRRRGDNRDYQAFEEADKIFKNETIRGHAGKLVMFFSEGFSNNADRTTQLAAAFRGSNIKINVYACGEVIHHENHKQYLEGVAGGKENVIYANLSDPDGILGRLPGNVGCPTCVFKSPGICVPGFVSPVGGECGFAIFDTVQCVPENCIKICDILWPWQDIPECTNGQGDVTIERVGVRTPQVEHCQPSKSVPCRLITTTTTTTTTKMPKTTTTAAISSTAAPNEAEVDKDAKMQKDESSYWMWILLGVLAVILLIVIVAAIVLTMRHRKKKRMVLLTKKTKVGPIVAIKSAVAVATTDVSIGPATAGRAEHGVGADLGDVSMGRGAAKTSDAEYTTGAAAAEQQIAADMSGVGGSKLSKSKTAGKSMVAGASKSTAASKSKIAANSPDVSGSKLSKSKMGKSTVDAASSSKKPPPAAQSIKKEVSIKKK